MGRVTVSTARTEPRKLLNISTVYWLADENLHSSGLPMTRMIGENVRPPSTIAVSVSRAGEATAIPVTFAVRRRFSGAGARQPIHSGALQELEISLDPLFDSLLADDPLGLFVLTLNPPANALSTGPAGPDTGDNNDNRPGNCGAGDDQFDGLFRPIRLGFEVVRVGGELEIRNLQNDEALPPLRGPHWTAVLHPDMSTGARQRIMLDWKPDWIRRVLSQRKPVTRSRGRQNVAMVVLHNTGGLRTDAEAAGRRFPNCGATIITFLNHATKGINYVVDVDGHVTKMAHEAFGTNHAGESGQTPRWDHVGTRGGAIRAAAVGIEHSLFESKPEFYPALVSASVDLVQHIVHAFPTIMPWNFVGHSDVVRKPACPGANFPWHRYEASIITRSAPPPTPGTLPFPMALGADNSHQPDESTIYNGFFAGNPAGILRAGISAGDAVRELQSDMREIGYRFHGINGHFDDETENSVRQFHTRFMNGARETPPDFSRVPPREVNMASAIQIKRVLNKLDSLRASIP